MDVQAALDGAPVEEIAARLHLARNTVYLWLHRFEVRRLVGLEDQPRGGRPSTYSREQVGEIVATALTDPQTLDLPFQSWTLDRLVVYLAEQKCIVMKRSRLGDVLLTEGLRWRKQERRLVVRGGGGGDPLRVMRRGWMVGNGVLPLVSR